MTTLSLAEARANLLGADDYDSLLETLAILSNPDEVAAIRDGFAELEADQVFTADEVRAAVAPREA